MLRVRTVGDRQLVVTGCRRCEAAGVRREMSLTHARALLEVEPIVEAHDAHGDAAALQRLAEWATRFTPLVAADPPDGLIMDIAGCQRLFRGERRQVHRIAAAVGRLGFTARIAVAPTFAASRALARFAPRDRGIVHDDELLRALAPLPIEALRVEPEAIDGLREVGVDRIQDLLALPRSSLAGRFDADLLLQLDRATGQAIETIDPVRPVEPARVAREFAGPVKQLEAITQTVVALLGELGDVLARRESGARRVELVMDRIDAEPTRLATTLSRPSRDAKHLWSLMRDRVERINLGYGVERVALSATRTAKLAHEQLEPWPSDERSAARRDESLGRLIDTLTHRLGGGRVRRVEVAESHLPERVYRGRPVTAARRRGEAAVAADDRPTVLLHPPEPVEVIAMTPDAPPSWLRWRGVAGRVLRARGPRRLAAEWWRPDAGDHERDYFQVGDDRGRWLWIYREHATGEWFAHGIWT